MKIVKLLEESGLLIKGVTEAIKNKAKEKRKRLSPNIIRHFRS